MGRRRGKAVQDVARVLRSPAFGWTVWLQCITYPRCQALVLHILLRDRTLTTADPATHVVSQLMRNLLIAEEPDQNQILVAR